MDSAQSYPLSELVVADSKFETQNIDISPFNVTKDDNLLFKGCSPTVCECHNVPSLSDSVDSHSQHVSFKQSFVISELSNNDTYIKDMNNFTSLHNSQSDNHTTDVLSHITNSESTNFDYLDHVFMKSCLQSDTFWNFYRLIESPKDGHCLLHSVISSLRISFQNNNLSLNKLQEVIMNEMKNSCHIYNSFFDGTSADLLAEAEAYIYARDYNNGFCDILPTIIANILNIEVIVINHVNDNVNVFGFIPDRCIGENLACHFCKGEIASIVLYRKSDHFDSCLPITCNFETRCDCFIKDLSPLTDYLAGPNDIDTTSIPDVDSLSVKSFDCQKDIELFSDAGSSFKSDPYSASISSSEILNSPTARGNNANGLANDISVHSENSNVDQSGKDSSLPDVGDTCIRNEELENNSKNISSILRNFRKKHLKQLIFGHMNINSYRWKFQEVNSELLSNNVLDLVFFSESKLDSSFPPSQFSVPGFRDPPFRADRNRNGGGLIAYIRSDIPCRRRYDIEMSFYEHIECIALETTIRKEKWLFLGFYKPPRIKDHSLIQSLENVINTFHAEFKCMYFLGDSNIDQLKIHTKFETFLDAYGMTCIIKGPTCFKGTPSLIDVILTDTPGRIAETLNIDTGLSDFHHLTLASTKLHVPRSSSTKFQYRSMKHFDEKQFLKDVSYIPFQVCNIFDDPNDSYWLFSKMYSNIIDIHAPVKTTRKHPKHAPFMNCELRKARNAKAMLRRKYEKYPSASSWERYRKQRNFVTKLRKKSIRQYFLKNCDIKNPSTHFWKTIKPFMSQKIVSQNGSISLYEDDKIVSDANDVCNIFNSHFATCANSIGHSVPLTPLESGASISESYNNHPSIRLIGNQGLLSNFQFTEVDTSYVSTLLSKVNVKKSTGYDNISPRLLKISSSEIAEPLTNLINMSIKTSIFPDILKQAEVSPLFKKDDNMNKNNFRPVSILACISKIFEKVYSEQMMEFFNSILSISLSAFRKQYSCETVLIRLVEDWKALLDKQQIVGAMLLDLSKAFDCLPHSLMIAKLEAYGFNKDACNLIHSYLINRKQRVKIGDSRSEWLGLVKGVPQGSILGPLLFNIFLNDIFYLINGLYNYADDNTISRHGETVAIVKRSLEDATNSALEWFEYNEMKANPSKFQALLLGTDSKDLNTIFNVKGADISPSTSVNLLGIEIDNKLNFSKHISKICTKAGQQLSALARLSKILDRDTKLTVFNSFVLSNFNYCPLVWHHCSIADNRKIEKIQERGLRFIYNDCQSSYSELLSRANKNILYIERLKKLAVFVFKCKHQIGPATVHDLFVTKQFTYSLRDSSKFVQPKSRTTTFGLNSLKYSGTTLWNKNLPIELKKLDDFDVFKKLVKTWSGPSCKCGVCTQCKLSD